MRYKLYPLFTALQIQPKMEFFQEWPNQHKRIKKLYSIAEHIS